MAEMQAAPRSEEQEKNHEFALRVNRETRANPASPYAGKYLGIAGQQVVAVADRMDELDELLDGLGLGRGDCVCVEASADYDTPIEFWSPLTFTLIPEEPPA